MAKIDKTRQILRQDAEDGNLAAAHALHDYEMDQGSVLCQPLKVGDWVYIYTATHAFVSQLVGIDHEEYVLKAPVTWVFDTGELTSFVEQGLADYCESYPAEIRVRRGGTVIVARYPINKHPTQRQR